MRDQVPNRLRKHGIVLLTFALLSLPALIARGQTRPYQLTWETHAFDFDSGTFTKILKGKRYQDSHGRRRVELTGVAPGADSEVRLFDPLTRESVVLNSKERLATVRSLAPDRESQFEIPDTLPPPRSEILESEEIGEKRIWGIPVVGTWMRINFRHLVEIEMEAWEAEEFGGMPFEVITTMHLSGQTNRTRYRVTGIRTSEPDPRLFQIPDGYEIVEGEPNLLDLIPPREES